MLFAAYYIVNAGLMNYRLAMCIAFTKYRFSVISLIKHTHFQYAKENSLCEYCCGERRSRIDSIARCGMGSTSLLSQSQIELFW